MSRDCVVLSPRASEIFAKLELFFPQDTWGRPCWNSEGTILYNRLYDLRRHEDREKLERAYLHDIGYSITIEAMAQKKMKGKLIAEFVPQSSMEQVRTWLEILAILDELAFQINTNDIVEDVFTEAES